MQAAALWWKGRLQPNGEVHAPHAPRCYSLQLCGGEAGNPRHPCLGGCGKSACGTWCAPLTTASPDSTVVCMPEELGGP